MPSDRWHETKHQRCHPTAQYGSKVSVHVEAALGLTWPDRVEQKQLLRGLFDSSKIATSLGNTAVAMQDYL